MMTKSTQYDLSVLSGSFRRLGIASQEAPSLFVNNNRFQEDDVMSKRLRNG